MPGTALKYVLTECTGSAVVNALLNLGAAYLLFRGRVQIPAGGPTGLVRDSIGEIFLVVSLSYMAAALISRQRRRAGTLPNVTSKRASSPGNVYLWSFGLGLLFTCLLVPVNGALLPRLFPDGATLGQAVLLKAIVGAVLGALASWLAISKALHEVHPARSEVVG